jgi:hypothetical protein
MSVRSVTLARESIGNWERQRGSVVTFCTFLPHRSLDPLPETIFLATLRHDKTAGRER